MVHLLKVRMQNGGGYRAVKTNDSLNQKASKPRKVNFTVRTASNVGHPISRMNWMTKGPENQKL